MAKRCPGCGYLMLGYTIGHDLAFGLDQCGQCNSFWLDGGEWATLWAHNLHDKLHRITNAPWQRQVRAAASRATWAAISSAKFGAAPYAELQRVKQWLAAQPEHQRMLAYLNDPDPYTQ